MINVLPHERIDFLSKYMSIIEETEVVGQRFGRRRIDDDDGVVSEAFEEDFARCHRGDADPRCGRRGRCRRRGCRPQAQQQQQ